MKTIKDLQSTGKNSLNRKTKPLRKIKNTTILHTKRARAMIQKMAKAMRKN
jgi:hypothetical protein